MKKWEKCYISLVGIIVIIAFLIAMVSGYNGVEEYNEIAILLCFLAGIALLVYYIRGGIILLKMGIHNIRKYDEEPFNALNKYKKCFGESNEYYIKQIQAINALYRTGGPVDDLVNKREIMKLYARRDFLTVQVTLFDNLMVCFQSLAISVVASFICQLVEYEGIQIFLWIIVTIGAFLLIVLYRYKERGQDGSYRYLVVEYEKRCLQKRIEELEEKLVISAENEDLLETKQVVIDALIGVWKKSRWKKKKQVAEELKCVQNLDLYIDDYTECYKRKIYVNGKVCYLVYDKEAGKENNYIGELNLKKQEYSIMYAILSKYDLIKYDI